MNQYSSSEAIEVPRSSGITEVVYNPLRRELFWRGFAFSHQGTVSPLATLADGQTLAPLRQALPRKDIQKKFQNCRDANCGFEFLLANVASLKSIGPIQIHDGAPEKTDLNLPVKFGSEMKQISTDIRIHSITVSLLEYDVRIIGELLGNVEGEIEQISIGGVSLANVQVRSGENAKPVGGSKKIRSGSFKIAAALATKINDQAFQITPAAGQKLEIVFRANDSQYRIRFNVDLMAHHLRPVIGKFTAMRTSQANNLVEFRGAFFGRFRAARVQLSIGGNVLDRNARLEREPFVVPMEIPELLDAPFAEWVWCDELDIDAIVGSALTAELFNGMRKVGSCVVTLEKGMFRDAPEPLAPSYFVSPLEGTFNKLLAKAESIDEPIVLIAMPGDVLRTFGGGPTRVVEMARYLTSMGYAVGLIDIAENADDADQLPESSPPAFRFRIGLAKGTLDELIHLAHDRVLRETGLENLTGILDLAHISERPTGDLLQRRTNLQFNALAAFFTAIAKPDFVICNFAWTAGIFDFVGSSVCKILDIHDVQHLRGLAHLEMTGDDSQQTDLAHEIEAWRKADYLLAIQDEEKDFVITESGRNNVIVCGHACPAQPFMETADDNHVVVFIGNSFPPNTLGIKRFIERNWSAVRARVPDATLKIVGNVGADLDDVPEGVEIAGVVPDLGAVYREAAVVINPVEFGSGLSIKSIEALCFGKCMVTTAAGVRGIRLDEGTARQTPAATMHEDVIELLLDPAARHRYERAAMDFAETNLTADRVFRELFNTMELRLYS